MADRYSRFFFPLTLLACCLAAVYLTIFRPGYLTSTRYLGALIFLQIVAAAVWKFRERFFLLLLAAFLWAGIALPMRSVWVSGRWFVLTAGALVGVVMYMKDPRHHFGGFHLVGLFAIVAALISALVSAYAEQAMLKAVSLLLLFLYAASGARLAVMGREASFLKGLLLGCEILTYVSAAAYFIFRFEIFDNPNSLGAVMGVVVVPTLLWGLIASEKGRPQRRRSFALVVAVSLLLSSYARAGIAAGTLACLLLCIASRQYRLLIKGVATAAVLAVTVAGVAPIQEHQGDSVASRFVYKGHREDGILGSRVSVWQRASDDIQEHPWFGTGFGTSVTRADANNHHFGFRSNLEATREHGNSYLAIVEWVGLLGVLPFVAMVLLLGKKVARVARWTRRGGSALSPAVPIAAIVAAGLLHAGLEDWLFAPGYYLCVFFWSLAFVLVDVVPKAQGAVVLPMTQRAEAWAGPMPAALP